MLVKTSNPGGRMLQDLVAGRPAAVPARGGVRRATGARHGGRLWLRRRRGGRGRDVSGATGRAAGARCRTRGSWCPATAAKAARPATWRPPLTRADGRDRQQLARHPLSPTGETIRRALRPLRWQEAVEAATRDMIDQLRAETPAGKLAKP